MSNVRRSWSKRGERTIVQNQQEFANRYLYTAIDPIFANSFHISGFGDAATKQTEAFLLELQKAFLDNHLVIVWDRAPFHRPKLLCKEHMTIIYLPSYSPQLNPVERFFEEIRKASANRIFREGINELETLDLS